MALTAVQARRRYLILHGLRWFPAGLIMPVLVLLLLERGLTLSQVGMVAAIQGFTVLVLEMPTGGLADALGRKPVLLLAASINLASLALLVVAEAVAVFALVWLLQGVFRALDSGPLQAWYVDAALQADPKARFESGLSGAGVVLGLSIAGGAVGSSVLVATHPFRFVSALTGPMLVAVAMQALHLAALAMLVVEVRPRQGLAAVRASIREVPAVIGSALGLLRRSRILLGLITVELLWGFGQPTYEVLMPIRLAEVVDDPGRAAVLMGPAGAAAWLVSALGAALVPAATRLVGAAWAAAAGRILQGTAIVAMGLVAGPVGVIAAYLGCYLIHGAANPIHQGLLHRQVEGPYRATVLSLNSMAGLPASAIGGITLTLIADHTSITFAMIAGAAVLAAAAPLYLTARRTPTDQPATATPIAEEKAG
jgi:MFS family permease